MDLCGGNNKFNLLLKNYSTVSVTSIRPVVKMPKRRRGQEDSQGKRRPDGTIVKIFPDGSEELLSGLQTDRNSQLD